MVEWVQLPFEQVLQEPVRNGIYKPKEFHGHGTKIVNMGELFGHPRLRAVPMRRLELTSSELKRFSLAEGDLIFARRSLVAEGAGKCSIVLEVDEDTTFESSIIRARPDSYKASSLFLYYFFNSPVGFHLLDTIRRQVAVAGITGTDLAQLAIPIPTLAEQRTIASILAALDDKIDLNRRINETLEAIARAIFKDWFVDFGPTRAKMEGHDPYLTPEIWSLFPDLLDSESKPQGWRIEPLLQHARLISGGTPKTEIAAYWNGPIAWASAKDVSQCAETFLIGTDRTITERGLDESATRIVPKLATVVVARGATTGRFRMFGRDMAMNQTCYALASTQGRGFWLNCTFASLVDSLVHAAHGSVFDTITTNTIEGARTTISDPALLDHFEATVSPLFNRVLANIEESETLAATRDLLLPKLMSGEIRVRDTEKIAEAVQ
jgi:type I restriction enzyme S subunit